MIELSAAAAGIAAILVVAARTFGVLLFGASAMSKALHFDGFVNAITGYGLLPARSHRLVAAAIIACEAATAMLLAAGPFVRLGALAAIVMLALFAAAMALALWRDRGDIDCGCFFGGGGSTRIDGWLIGRNLFFAAILAPAALWPLQPGSADAMIILDGVGFACACFLLGELLGQLVKVRHARIASLGGRD